MNSKKVTLGLLLFYLIALIWIIVFKLQFSFENLPHMRNFNFLPFGASVMVNGEMDLSEMIQNVLVFIPFGCLLHILWEQKSLLKQFIPILCTSLLFEIIQFTFAIGASDITDIITNSFGGIMGILIAVAVSNVTGKNRIKFINIIGLSGAVVFTLLIAVLLLANP